MHIILYSKHEDMPFVDEQTHRFDSSTGKVHSDHAKTKYIKEHLFHKKMGELRVLDKGEESLLSEHPWMKMLSSLSEINLPGLVAHVLLGNFTYYFKHGEEEYQGHYLSSNIHVVLTIHEGDSMPISEPQFILLWKTPKEISSPIDLMGPGIKRDKVTQEEWKEFFLRIVQMHITPTAQREFYKKEELLTEIKNKKKQLKIVNSRVNTIRALYESLPPKV